MSGLCGRWRSERRRVARLRVCGGDWLIPEGAEDGSVGAPGLGKLFMLFVLCSHNLSLLENGVSNVFK